MASPECNCYMLTSTLYCCRHVHVGMILKSHMNPLLLCYAGTCIEVRSNLYFGVDTVRHSMLSHGVLTNLQGRRQLDVNPDRRHPVDFIGALSRSI